MQMLTTKQFEDESGKGRSKRMTRIMRLGVGLIAAATFLVTPAFGAGLTVLEEAAPVETAGAPSVAPGSPVDCPLLTQAKYPFVSCVQGLSGQPELAVEGKGVPGASITFFDGFLLGGGYYGQPGE